VYSKEPAVSLNTAGVDGLLSSYAVKPCAVIAKATISRPPCEIVPFDVVSFGTGEVVVVYSFSGAL